MIQQELDQVEDKDLVAALEAMKQAAALARKIAIQTDTAIIMVREGQVVRITAEELREEMAKEEHHTHE